MSSAIESTLRRLDYVLGDLPWGRAHLDCFITDFIHQFEVGQPEEVAYRVEHEGDGEFDGDDGEVYLSWDDIELELWVDPWGLLQAQYPESLDPIMEGYIGEQLLAAHERRVVDGVAEDFDEDTMLLAEQVLGNELSDFCESFTCWGDLYEKVEELSTSMAQCSVAMEWCEGEREHGKEPEEMGFLVAAEGEMLLVGHEQRGVRVDADGSITEAYSVP